ncbi:seryl-tRNA synthetase [Chitinophaga costaii]|uniref:Serine--tRNA ligase n=1 Tax=Chitinophaga costaii TaxID=1335309 RepID=A0A1C4DQ75_9BACT|nr:serine--tRNA ligase [Chitinophaga costaii]PUZ27736.1 serine--tRNA ligase [Chitinophaga costaii]SCC33513.1 seryl-tRNA synthetase [Chitinophaga costaii]
MLQVQFIRQNKDLVLERLALKQFKELSVVDEVLSLDDRRKKLTLEYDETQAQVNVSSKEIGKLMAAGDKEGAESRKAAVATLKQRLQPINDELKQVEENLTLALYKLPNLPHSSVPAGKTPEDNVVVRSGGPMPTLHAGAKPHWELTSQYDLIDFELGTRITGSGFPVYKNKGAKLQRALIQYFLDYNTDNGYTEFQPPYLVNAESATGTGQLPDKEGQMYHVTEDGFYLIPTAEVPVTNIYRDTIIKESELPIKMTAYTPCFRREAGSYGKDVRGLNRLHQFDKVELVQLVHPDTSYDTLENMVQHVEKLILSLELPYRILRLCGGDMSFTSALTYDFEVYSAAQGRWLEVSSVSNFEGYQTNRLKARFKDSHGKSQLVHSLNGSSLALPRILACLLENHQTADGIAIPASLQPYFGSAKIG